MDSTDTDEQLERIMKNIGTTPTETEKRVYKISIITSFFIGGIIGFVVKYLKKKKTSQIILWTILSAIIGAIAMMFVFGLYIMIKEQYL